MTKLEIILGLVNLILLFLNIKAELDTRVTKLTLIDNFDQIFKLKKQNTFLQNALDRYENGKK